MIHIKFCGITNLQDALDAQKAGADMLGFNFYPPSSRSITPDACAKITTALKEVSSKITLAGVFVNMPFFQVMEIMQQCFLDFAQLHGDESPQDVAAFQGLAIKAFRGTPDESHLAEYINPSPRILPAFLVDAQAGNIYGGSGITADWRSAAKLAKKYPFLLAGGLKPDNILEAITQVQPWGVDCASGIESRPGKKDALKMKAFVETVRSSE